MSKAWYPPAPLPPRVSALERALRHTVENPWAMPEDLAELEVELRAGRARFAAERKQRHARQGRQFARARVKQVSLLPWRNRRLGHKVDEERIEAARLAVAARALEELRAVPRLGFLADALDRELPQGEDVALRLWQAMVALERVDRHERLTLDQLRERALCGAAG